MSTKTKLIVAGMAALALGILLLPRLARRIDSTLDPMWERAAAMEAQYRNMTNAYPIAAEMAPDHPTARLWRERRAALLAGGYIETREFELPRPLAAKGAVNAFFAAFHSRFPGVECSVRAPKSDEPVLVVTARKSDLGLFGDIKSFARQYEPTK
jgi:hypothetical protein